LGEGNRLISLGLILIAYLLGSISFSILLSKRLIGTDIRQHGSGNAGATNTLRVLGKKPAFFVLMMDLFKGILAVWLAYWFVPGSDWAAVLSGLAAIAGHNWPIYFAFRGGKGIATTVGVLGTLALIPVLISSAVALTIIAITRYVSLGSLVFVTVLPVVILLFDETVPLLIASILVLVLGYARHAKNISNLIQGKERKLGES
jgi:glycerol-3-phosphate acyltransferase PlsY